MGLCMMKKGTVALSSVQSLTQLQLTLDAQQVAWLLQMLEDGRSMHPRDAERMALRIRQQLAKQGIE